MSVYARRKRMTDTCTFWKLTSTSVYGASWASPVTVSCNFRNNSAIARDDAGAEFSPNSIYRFYGDPAISKGDRIVRGTSTSADPTDDAQTVRKIETKTALRGLAAYDVFTG